MYKELVHIYGPFAIQSYGFCIAIGLYLILFLIQRHPAFKKLNLEPHFASLILMGVFSGLLGGRILYTISSGEIVSIADFFSYWNGGFSILGCVIALCITLPLWLSYCNIPILPFLDLLAIYAPLLQSISRIGCLLAGCCHGIATTIPWGVIYHDPQSMAPLHICLHPTQLYSSILLFSIFCLLYGILQYRVTKPGQLLAAYLFLSSGERLIVDFWRADRIFLENLEILSVHQWIALMIMSGALLLFLASTYYPQSHSRQRSP